MDGLAQLKMLQAKYPEATGLEMEKSIVRKTQLGFFEDWNRIQVIEPAMF